METVSLTSPVVEGAKLLDLAIPGWWDNVNLTTFDMSDADFCVLGQNAGQVGLPGYAHLVRWLADVDPMDPFPCGFVDDYGFEANVGDAEAVAPAYEALTEKWRNEIENRKAGKS
jgi:hypothetical protein